MEITQLYFFRKGGNTETRKVESRCIPIRLESGEVIKPSFEKLEVIYTPKNPSTICAVSKMTCPYLNGYISRSRLVIN
jgi:hypothetical protein